MLEIRGMYFLVNTLTSTRIYIRMSNTDVVGKNNNTAKWEIWSYRKTTGTKSVKLTINKKPWICIIKHRQY